jgi:hypothetical protein
VNELHTVPRFPNVYCSQCGSEFGPGDHGFSHCWNHQYGHLIGKKVRKLSRAGTEPKPFKSKSKINTVKGIIQHPILAMPAFTFEEDDSYVECRKCVEVV